MKLQNEEVMLKNNWNLSQMNKTVQWKKCANFSKKVFELYYTNIDKVEIFHVLQ